MGIWLGDAPLLWVYLRSHRLGHSPQSPQYSERSTRPKDAETLTRKRSPDRSVSVTEILRQLSAAAIRRPSSQRLYRTIRRPARLPKEPQEIFE